MEGEAALAILRAHRVGPERFGVKPIALFGPVAAGPYGEEAP